MKPASSSWTKDNLQGLSNMDNNCGILGGAELLVPHLVCIENREKPMMFASRLPFIVGMLGLLVSIWMPVTAHGGATKFGCMTESITEISHSDTSNIALDCCVSMHCCLMTSPCQVYPLRGKASFHPHPAHAAGLELLLVRTIDPPPRYSEPPDFNTSDRSSR